MSRLGAPLLFALAAALPAACAQEDRASVTPLPPSGPTVIGAPPLESMAEYRRTFALRGTDPDWTGSMRPGELRLRAAGAPDKVIPLTLPTPCFVVGCSGALFDTHETRRAVAMSPQPCRIGSAGPEYPYKVTLVRPGVGEPGEKLVGCARPGAEPIPGPAIRPTPAPPRTGPPPATAADVRDALDRQAMRAISDNPATLPSRPWHSGAWLREGKGAVGRLHDLCTGAVEPKPALSVGSWTWETLDPRRLGAADRQALLQWRMQQMASAYACGTIFDIGDLGSKARQAAGRCPAPADGSPTPSPLQAFVAYVNRHPQARDGADPLAAATAALREAGCG